MRAHMKLYGTTTSPFVRRVRIVAQEQGRSLQLLDVNQEQLQAEMRALSPIWKVPVAVMEDGRVIFDSRVIIQEMCAERGWAPLRAPATTSTDRVEEENLINLIDEATFALIRNFYLQRDGGSLDLPYAQKDAARAHAVLQHLETTAHRFQSSSLGRAELVLCTSLDWMGFRNTYPTQSLPKLQAVCAAHRARPSFASTVPVAA
jgi:glutathione S-transferase